MEVSLRAPIAEGRTAEIFAWGEGQVLKLYREGWDPDWAEYEARVARSVHASGQPVPAVGELIQVNGRLGLVYERLEGPSLLRLMSANPWRIGRSACLLAELHAGMHSNCVPDIPSQRQRLRDKIQRVSVLTSGEKQALLERLDRLPEGDRLCHGDFHPDNILMTRRGPVIIDWTDATRGSPLADVARTSLLLSGGSPAVAGPVIRLFLLLGRRWFHRSYLRHYFRLLPEGRELLASWRPVIAAARLLENISEEQDLLLDMVRSGLAEARI